jgi:hypothetical protein
MQRGRRLRAGVQEYGPCFHHTQCKHLQLYDIGADCLTVSLQAIRSRHTLAHAVLKIVAAGAGNGRAVGGPCARDGRGKGHGRAICAAAKRQGVRVFTCRLKRYAVISTAHVRKGQVNGHIPPHVPFVNGYRPVMQATALESVEFVHTTARALATSVHAAVHFHVHIQICVWTGDVM